MWIYYGWIEIPDEEKQMRRILHVTKELNSGGIEAFVKDLFPFFYENDVQIDFVIHWHSTKGIWEDYFHQNDVQIYYFYNLKECRGERKYRKQWKEFWKQHKGEYDIVHAHYMSHEGIILQEAKRAGIKTIAHSHSLSKKNAIARLVRRYFNRALLANADMLLACSKLAGESFFKQEFARNGIVIHNAISTELFSYNKEIRCRIRKVYDLHDRFVIGHVGNYVSAKNQDFLLEIIGKVKEQKPDAVLVWAGYISEVQMNHIKTLLISYQIERNVIFLGCVQNVQEWMQAFDLFLFPSTYEGLGTVLIEAQAAGLPCVISDTIPPEVNVTDLITRVHLSDSAKQWANTLLEINMEKDRAEYHAQVASAGYEASAVAKQLCDLYHTI